MPSRYKPSAIILVGEVPDVRNRIYKRKQMQVLYVHMYANAILSFIIRTGFRGTMCLQIVRCCTLTQDYWQNR